MLSTRIPAVLAGALSLGLTALPALADPPGEGGSDEKPAPMTTPKEGTPAPAPAPPAAPAPSAAPGTGDERDKKIEEQEKRLEEQQKLIQELLKRVEELEKRTPKEPEPTPDPDPTVTPPTQPQLPGRQPPRGGATLIPNISVVGNTIFRAGDTRGTPNRGRFTFDELEIAFQDQVAPKLRYDVFIAAGEEENWNVELEEGFLTATGIFPGVNARAGRIRTPIGKFNPLHPHQWVFITRPSAHHALLGDHGLITDGAVVDWLLPTKGFYSNLQFGAWRNTTAAPHVGHAGEEEGEDDHDDDGDDHDDHAGVNPFDEGGFHGGDNFLYSTRFALGKALTRNQELELGFSRVWGRGEVEDFGRKMLAMNGIDLTYRSYPAAFKRIMLQAELLAQETHGIGGDTKFRPGGYLMGAYRWNRYWEAGARLDYTQFPYPVEGNLYGGSLFLTKYLTEQTSLRLEYRHEKHPLYGHGNGIFFQVLFGSGPHVHPLQ